MQNMKIYNTFEFVGTLGVAKETEKFKPYTKNTYDSGWVKEELKLNVKANESSEMISIADGYFDKKGYTFGRKGAKIKQEDGSFKETPDLKIAWEDRKSKTIIDKVASYQKYVLDLSNNKERYDLRQAIEKLSDDAVSDETIEELKKKFILISGLKETKDMVETLKEELDNLNNKKTEYLSRVDMIEDVKKLINTEQGTNTIFKITGNIVFSEWKGKVYKTFEVNRIEKATSKDKLKLSGNLDLYFTQESLDDSSFEETKKYIINAHTKTYDGQLKKQIYVPLTLVADGSRLDFNNEKHVKRLNGLIKPLKNFEDDEVIYQLPYEVKFANGSEKVEITMDDLTDYQRELIEDGVLTFEEAKMDLGGDKFGDRVREIRLFKPYIKDDFMNGAVDTDLTLDDFVIIRPEKEAEKPKEEEVEIDNTVDEDEEDVDDLI